MHGKAKEESEIANEKEVVETSAVRATGKSKRGNIEMKVLQDELDKMTGSGKTEAYDVGEEFEILFRDSNRYYTVDKDGNVGDVKIVEKDTYPGDITKGLDGKLLDGSEENPYEINCIEDLVALSNITNGEGYKIEDGKMIQITSENPLSGKYVVLRKTLNFKSPLSYTDCNRTDFGDINGNTEDGNKLITELTTGNGFKPIGASESRSFEGNFNGLDNKIEEIYINRQNMQVGLFSKISAVNYKIKIQNLGVSGKINVSGDGGSAGGIAGWITSTGNSTNIEIVNCYNLADITVNAKGSAGGIVGWGKVVSAVIKNCYNLGNITGNNIGTMEGVGGIYGFAYSPVIFKNCYNLGNVTSDNPVGGIVGHSYQAVDFLNCYNLGNYLRGGSTVGGISGNDGWTTHNYINCYNMAIKMEGTNIGGLSGSSPKKDYIIIKNCYYDKNLAQNGVHNWTEVAGNGLERVEINSVETVKKLNDYIERGIENEEGIDTSDWKKWKVGEEGYPIFE